jgi:hypothetical protein
MMTMWKNRTNLGRVVYERPKHLFKTRDAYRVVYHVMERMTNDWSLENDPKYGDLWSWERILEIAQIICKRLYKPPVVQELPDNYNSTTQKNTPTQLQWTAARLIYYITNIQMMIGSILGLKDLPFVSEVWKVGSWILDIALDGLKKKLGPYSYTPPPNESLTL